jgi:predicted SnoaL-like aldol condensation-catalyzing enzyme
MHAIVELIILRPPSRSFTLSGRETSRPPSVRGARYSKRMRGALQLSVALIGLVISCSTGSGPEPSIGGGGATGSPVGTVGGASTSPEGGAATAGAATAGAAGTHSDAEVGGGASTDGAAPGGASGSSSAGGGGAGSGGAGGVMNGCDPDVAVSNKARVNAALQALFVDKQISAIGEYWAEPYLQHNPIAKSGVAAFQSVMSSVVSSPSFMYERLRSLAECDLVVVQGRYSGTGVIFDLFRVKDGNLVEHWDSDSNQASDAGGATEPVNPEQTGANRSVVLAYLEQQASHYLSSDYVDHRAAAASTLTYTKVHHVVADGSLVFALSEGTLDGKPYGFYDLFRLEGGKLAEHWDSRRAVPATTASGLGIF